ncbi:sodium:solute symporter family transporter [Geomesophilobacter sediminis]|uniref:Cation acetate symporter n=1 Tax=Geomesophilobacter sediminis TaxID=2798584 RepID=A0A8J7IQV4_9BACT|nr:cation acetate symporter [Geomesophilobacter sediminis]MBJ6725119.1 cation acetate symporter [Geomesophilobacter sediminis]
MNDASWTIGIVLFVLVSFLLVGLRQKSRESLEYGFGGRYTGRIGGGAAIASNWMSAASLMGLGGIIYLQGYQALAYVIGWTGGYVLLLVLLASQIRRFGKFTAPDFIAERYGSPVARFLAALISIGISIIYCTAQFKGIGLLFSFMLGVEYNRAVLYGGAAVVSYLVIAGALGVPRNQQMLYFVICVSFIVPLMWLAHHLGYFWILPQFGYGEAISDLARQYQIDFTLPFTSGTLFGWVSLCFTLMVGTAGLPHVLSRFYTVPNVRDARWSVVWGLFFIALIYWSAPAFAVFGRLLEVRTGIRLPPPAAERMADLVVMKTAVLAGMPGWLVGVLAAGALSAAFFTVAGLLMTGAASVSYDLYYCLINPKANESDRMAVAKGSTLVLAGIVLLLALNPWGLIVQITALAFALAGNTLFPLLLLGIWWDRANRYGAIAGMLVGLCCTFAQPLLGGTFPILAQLFPLTSSALCGAPLVILVMIAVSLATKPPPDAMRDFLEHEVHGHLD